MKIKLGVRFDLRLRTHEVRPRRQKNGLTLRMRLPYNVKLLRIRDGSRSLKGDDCHSMV